VFSNSTTDGRSSRTDRRISSARRVRLRALEEAAVAPEHFGGAVTGQTLESLVDEDQRLSGRRGSVMVMPSARRRVRGS